MNLFLKILKSIFFFLSGCFVAVVAAFLFMTVWVNSAKVVEVPYIIGESEDIAVKALKEKHLQPNIEGTGNKVLYTEPGPGSKVKEGHHVIVQLRNIEKQKVPDLIGIPGEVAEQFLIEYKIPYTIQKIKTYQKGNNGIVISTEPEPGRSYGENKVKINIGIYEGVNE